MCIKLTGKKRQNFYKNFDKSSNIYKNIKTYKNTCSLHYIKRILLPHIYKFLSLKFSNEFHSTYAIPTLPN